LISVFQLKMVWYDMDTDPERPVQMNNLSNLRGQIERITFCNEENDFTIVKMKVPGEKDPPLLVPCQESIRVRFWICLGNGAFTPNSGINLKWLNSSRLCLPQQ
jgi:hypothetical protein